ncbi:tetratricopeptide repeat protein 19, mitochondrial isoform X3 [Scleropages formosus]|uniref:tetratricopeptide repeat protein 19, mitochondrial isoform X3 n=1 Tax=Scleropages formosus TaxID=113540 RepID=UPI0010FA7CEA|nr:tetratricopeptide repeat protein 19, mitochondrial isoform X3 [Scleropages formosus]
MAARRLFRRLPTCAPLFRSLRSDRLRGQGLRVLVGGQLFRRMPASDALVRLEPEAAWCGGRGGRGRSCADSWAAPPGGRSRNGSRGESARGPLLCAAVAFSLFSKTGDEEEEEDEAKKKEDEIIMLLKRAKAEKLFKAAMSFMLSGGTPEDDNAVIEMSLKLASIYGSQDQHELAEHGFRFCVESLEAKIEKQKDLSGDGLTDDERKDTRLLLGLCLDSRARYLTATRRLEQARSDYQRALQICQEEQGEAHPQSLVLMNDLATVLDAQGHHEEALRQISRAVALGKETGYAEQHVLLGNMAGILLHQGQLTESARLYREALAMAQAAGDGEAVENIQEGLKELGGKKDGQAGQA